MTDSLPRPPALESGDRVALVAPAGPAQSDQVERGAKLLTAWGLRIEIGAHALDRHPRLGYLAGADAERAADFTRAWLDPDVAAVFCVRGGYGSQRVLDHLRWAELAAAPPKLLVGSSDITALHSFVNDRLGVVSLFAPMAATHAFLDDPAARENLRVALFEPEKITELTRPSARPLVGGHAHGRLVGGNLSLLAADLGSGHPLPPPGSIAILEDIGEDPYRIDRYLTQLLRAGWFDRVAGIALGSWQDCGDPADVRAVLADRLGPLGVPTIEELGFGHCSAALTIPLGATAELDADAATLRLCHRVR